MRGTWQPRAGRVAAGVAATIALLPVAGARADDPGTLRGEATMLRSSNATLASRSHQALLDLYALESAIARAATRIAALEARAATIERREASARRQLEIARSGVGIAQGALGLRLRALYVEGEVDPLAVLLGAESLDEVVSALDGLGRFATQDREIVEQLTAARARLKSATDRLAARRSEAEAAVASARAARDSLVAARADREAYVAQLARRRAFNSNQIAQLTEEAAATEARAREVSGSAAGGTGIPSAPADGGRRMTVSSVSYCLRGTTATGIPAGPGVVAVDPRVIPLGTRMHVPGYGNGVAADTGSAVKGAVIDLWFSTCAQAMAWGRRTVTITLY